MPKIIDHAERRDEIADVVLELITEVGVTGVTLRAVAKRSNWSTGVISHYFGNRDGLLIAALRRSASIEGARQSRILATNRGIGAVAELLKDSLPVDMVRTAIVKTFLFFYIEGVVDERIRTETSSYASTWTRVIKKALNMARSQGELCDHLDLRVVADDLAAITWGMSVNMIVDGTLADRVDPNERVTSWVANLTHCTECEGSRSDTSGESSLNDLVPFGH